MIEICHNTIGWDIHITTIITIVTYNVTKPRVITLRETLHPRSQTYRKLNQEDPRDNEFREVATSSNIRNMTEYRVSSAKCTDELAYADVEIRIQVFGKISLTILLSSQLSMRNQCGTKTYNR
jgi:hypothetical protein